MNDRGEEKTNKGAPHVLKSALHALMRLCVGYDEAGSKRRRRAFNIGAIPACVAALETHFSPDVFEAVVHFNEALMRESATSQRMNPEMHAQWQEEMGRASPELKANVQRSMREKMQEKMAGMMDRGPPMPGLTWRAAPCRPSWRPCSAASPEATLPRACRVRTCRRRVAWLPLPASGTSTWRSCWARRWTAPAVRVP